MPVIDAADYATSQLAIDAAKAQGGGTVLLNNQVYDEPLTIDANVSLLGQPETIILQSSGLIGSNIGLIIESPKLAALPFTGTLITGQTTFTMPSPPSLAVDEEVMLLLGTDPHDPNEEFTRQFNTVKSVVGNDVTFNIPIPEDVPGTSHNIQKFSHIIDGITIENIKFDRVRDATTTSHSCRIIHAKNTKLKNVRGLETGASLVSVVECENPSIDGLHLDRGRAGITGSGPGLLTGWGFTNGHFTNLSGDVDAHSVQFESQVRGAVVDGLDVTCRDGLSTNVNSVDVSGGSNGVVIKNYKHNTGTLRSGPSAFNEGKFRTQDAIIGTGCKRFDLPDHTGSLTYRGVSYNRTRTFSTSFDLAANMSGVNIGTLPDGIYKNIRVRVSSTQGITNFSFKSSVTVGDTMLDELIAGQWVATKKPSLMSVGDSNPFNDLLPKTTSISTDGTVPGGATAEIEIEYYEP